MSPSRIATLALTLVLGAAAVFGIRRRRRERERRELRDDLRTWEDEGGNAATAAPATPVAAVAAPVQPLPWARS